MLVFASPTAGEPAGRSSVQGSEPIVVGFDAGVTRERRVAVLAAYGVRVRRDIAALRADEASVPAADAAGLLERLRAEPEVAFAELDRPVHLIRPVFGARLPLARASVVPDDEGFGYQYSLRQSSDHDVDATDAWNHRTQCATVAVVDSGIDTDHPDLRDNVWINEDEVHANGRDDDGNGYVDDWKGADMVDGTGSGIDRNGHGTHVGGVIAARGNNGRGVSGLCWKARIMSLRMMGADGSGRTSDAAEAIVYAVDHGVRIINASYGSPSPSDLERAAIDYAADHGALVVAAAGNERANADQRPFYPAAYDASNVISVAASDDRDQLAQFSNYGARSVDLAAPGDNIASAADGNDYRYASGTSQAAPLVAAAAAMLRKAGAGSPGEIRKLLLDHVDRKSSFKGRVASGGRLNVRRSLAALG